MGTYIGPGVWEIDTLLGGWTRMTAGYLIEGPAPVLVETGSQTSVPALLAALKEHGVAPADLFSLKGAIIGLLILDQLSFYVGSQKGSASTA